MGTSAEGNKKPETNRIRGIDSIRFICALMVALGHVMPATLFHFAVVRYGLGLIINGPAAVIVFFVISGFCIHYPFRKSGAPNLEQFYSRRLLRICIPMMTAIVLGFAFHYDYWKELVQSQRDVQAPSVLWSLVAEMIYYLLYPLLLHLRKRFGWVNLIIIAYVLSVCAIMTNPKAGHYPAFGNELNWVVGLPVWLLGCLLAETVTEENAVTPTPMKIWLWRGAALLAPVISVMLRNHSPIPIGYPWTLNVYAILVYFWLAAEFRWFLVHRPWTPLEMAGRWSYSLYLMHRPVMAGLNSLRGHFHFLPELVFWFLSFLVMLFVCYVFYLLVEKPSLNLAAWVSSQLKARQAMNRKEILRDGVLEPGGGN